MASVLLSCVQITAYNFHLGLLRPEPFWLNTAKSIRVRCEADCRYDISNPNSLAPVLARCHDRGFGGGRRLDKRASGSRFTVVSGEIIVQDDRPTGALPGGLVRGRHDRAAVVLCRTPDMRRTGQDESENWVVITLTIRGTRRYSSPRKPNGLSHCIFESLVV